MSQCGCWRGGVRCTSSGTHKLKLTFCQRSGRPRFAVTFTADVDFCERHALEYSEMPPVEARSYLIAPRTREMAAAIFTARGWGEIAWEETDFRFERVGAETGPAVRVRT